jgi:hypothetical protein
MCFNRKNQATVKNDSLACTIIHNNLSSSSSTLTTTLACSVSTVTADRANVSLVSQLLSFLVDCSVSILKGFGFVAFFAGVKASSFCIHLSCLVCIQSVVHGVWRLFYGH